MLQKLRSNSQGFTLIELMIVIAIIGILAAIAIPNFISYRNKAYCSAAESDANNIAAAIADYYAVPARTNMLAAGSAIIAKPNGLGLTLSNANTSTIGGAIDAITISVTEAANRCPSDYRNSQAPDWTGFVFSVSM
jgi:prepilin-type N-terminal cleavage/methylation domain-containing protein